VGGLFDDDAHKSGTTVLGCPVLGTIDAFAADCGGAAVVALGDNLSRRRVAERFAAIDWLTAVHPGAQVHSSVQLGPGTVVFAGAVIQPEATIGSHCIVNTGATIDHDAVVESYSHIAPGCHLAGEVHLEEGVFLGTGATVSMGVRVGKWTTVGAGAVVVGDLESAVVAVGVPARPLRKKEIHEGTDSDGLAGPGGVGRARGS
jgi:sugar O-acyltransferase (sialic acid O-acetyltransferase NeuD family)